LHQPSYAALLAEYMRARRLIIEPPIQIEDIVEKYLWLAIESWPLRRLAFVPALTIGIMCNPLVCLASVFAAAHGRLSTRSAGRRAC
jgi:hypothetical protein